MNSAWGLGSITEVVGVCVLVGGGGGGGEGEREVLIQIETW